MSIDMYVGSSQTQASTTSTKSQSDQQSYETMVQALRQFVWEDRLNSTAYTNAKSFYESVLIPLVQVGTLLSESVGIACQKFVDTYQSDVDSGDLKSDELEEKIRQLDIQLTDLENICTNITNSDIDNNTKIMQVTQNRATKDILSASKQTLEDKLEKLKNFESTSPTIFSAIAELEGLVTKGASQANESWTGTGFSIPSDLTWTETVATRWKENEERKIKEELSKYDVYAVIYEGKDGEPAVTWQIVDRETGLGIENQKLYRYLFEKGTDLDTNLFSFMTYEDHHKKEQEAFRNGSDYVTGTKYNAFMGKALSEAQLAEDRYEWTTETELGQAISTLGFAYASYKMYTSTGSKKS